MNCQPYVTVAIASYNHSQFINYCLDSVKKDNYLNKEILIIDDGSTDNSIEIIENWITQNPDIITRLIKRENKGLNATLNELVRNCSTEYFCLLASDDALMQNGISKRIDLLEKSPNKLAVIADAVVINSKNEIIYQSAIEELYRGNKENYMTDGKLKYSIINEFSIPGPVLLVKRKLYDVIGPYPNLFAEDIFFYLKVIGMELLIFLDEPVAYYRSHENNTGGNKKYAKEINKTFVVSYLKNMKYYKGRLKLLLIKKLLGRIYSGFLLRNGSM
jgi:glycosyltransferase involved in cell wall biosynthesis